MNVGTVEICSHTNWLPRKSCELCKPIRFEIAQRQADWVCGPRPKVTGLRLLDGTWLIRPDELAP